MRLVSIRLENVRRFHAPVQITGIGPGLNVLSAPNEHGKSTVFDALQAVFFVPHRSQAKEAKALRPHAGGAPAVGVEIDTAEGRFRIEKRWLSGAFAKVWQGERLIAQADEAEAWIARAVGPDAGGGPVGLLWVRQGATGLDQGSTAERQQSRSARRDLLSSVTGEVEAMTGGRRMEMARTRCQEDLDRYLTAMGRPRTGGPLKAAMDLVEALEAEKAAQAEKAQDLKQDLDRRRAVIRELSGLDDPAEAAQREERLAAARAGFDKATRHAEARDRARDAADHARLKVSGTQARLATMDGQLAELAEAEGAHGEAEALRETTAAARDTAEASLRKAAAEAEAARETASAAESLLRRALRAESAAADRDRRERLSEQIARAETLRSRIETCRAEAGIGPDAETLARLEGLAADVATQTALLQAGAPGVTIDYLAGAEGAITLDGAPVPGARRVALPEGGTLVLRGLGQLTIHPGQGSGAAEAARAAEARLREALERLGLPDLPAARAAARKRAEAGEALRAAEGQLALLAPSGIDALRTALAALPEPEAADPELPDATEAQNRAEAAATAQRQALAALETARGKAEGARTGAERAIAAAEAAGARLDRARAALATTDDPRAARAALAATLEAEQVALSGAEAKLEALEADAPDLAAAEAALKRAEEVIARIASDRARLTEERVRLDALIDHLSGQAVEEELADTTSRLEAAAAELARIRFEVEVLQTLAAALDAARATARDRYFEPVMRELSPLLRLFWPEATIRLDEEAVLPTALVRAGAEEEFDTLSGGTQEQIALLVRLAFARLLAADGRHAPVILDDALVYTDDDRIERMFDALHRQAADLQILVFSCRQRAFRELGGTMIALSRVEDAA
ncbi:AAA family ATPase [Halovulum dunhuangense]|uniref:AAA family ATPase n=1 Tax=Halovulum dunhuangense TaxID=1505036 RepID=A0A849KQ82_9RHOB|nr:ATP-binding protein [Halovulum dunhuangense]NNU78989.1 AAA family ATPase [Halovulum dunhuangense]